MAPIPKDFRNRKPNDQLLSYARDQPLAIRKSSRPHRQTKTLSCRAFCVLSFLVVSNLNQSLAEDVDVRNPSNQRAGPNDPVFLPGALKFDFLVLNMQWPVTKISMLYEKGVEVNETKFRNHVNRFGHRFTVHGLWAGINGEEKKGNTRVK